MLQYLSAQNLSRLLHFLVFICNLYPIKEELGHKIVGDKIERNPLDYSVHPSSLC